MAIDDAGVVARSHLDIDVRQHFPASLCSGTIPFKRDYRDVVNLSSNELDHPRLAEIYHPDVLREIAEQPVWRYADPASALRTASAACGLPVERAVLAAGSDDAIKALMWLIAPVSPRLVVQSPNYGAYLFHAIAAGGHPVRAEVFGTAGDERVQAIAEHVTSSACVVVTDPDPVEGVTIGVERMRALAALCARRAALLIIDATYANFAGVDHLPLAGAHANVIVIRSFSKSHGLAGARAALVAGAPEVIAVLRRWRLSNAVGSHTLGLLIHALSQPLQVWTELWADVRRWRTALVADLRRRYPSWTVTDSDANFVLVDTHDIELARTVVERLEQHGIVVKSFADLPEIATCLRISVSTPERAAVLLNTLAAVV